MSQTTHKLLQLRNQASEITKRAEHPVESVTNVLPGAESIVAAVSDVSKAMGTHDVFNGAFDPRKVKRAAEVKLTIQTEKGMVQEAPQVLEATIADFGSMLDEHTRVAGKLCMMV